MKFCAYSINEMREKVNMTDDRGTFTDIPTVRAATEKHTNFSEVEDDGNVALRAEIPIIPDMPRRDSSDSSKLSRKLYTAQLLLLNRKHY